MIGRRRGAGSAGPQPSAPRATKGPLRGLGGRDREGAGGPHHRLVTGYSPRGRHSSTATISAMFENSATLGATKPV